MHRYNNNNKIIGIFADASGKEEHSKNKKIHGRDFEPWIRNSNVTIALNKCIVHIIDLYLWLARDYDGIWGIVANTMQVLSFLHAIALNIGLNMAPFITCQTLVCFLFVQHSTPRVPQSHPRSNSRLGDCLSKHTQRCLMQ